MLKRKHTQNRVLAYDIPNIRYLSFKKSLFSKVNHQLIENHTCLLLSPAFAKVRALNQLDKNVVEDFEVEGFETVDEDVHRKDTFEVVDSEGVFDVPEYEYWEVLFLHEVVFGLGAFGDGFVEEAFAFFRVDFDVVRYQVVELGGLFF